MITSNFDPGIHSDSLAIVSITISYTRIFLIYLANYFFISKYTHNYYPNKPYKKKFFLEVYCI